MTAADRCAGCGGLFTAQSETTWVDSMRFHRHCWPAKRIPTMDARYFAIVQALARHALYALAALPPPTAGTAPLAGSAPRKRTETRRRHGPRR